MLPLLALCANSLFGQQPKAPVITSPEVMPDRSVVFRLWAPKATEVLLSGDWMGPQPPVALSRSDDGTWSTTIAPLAPNLYTYGFLVDGVRTTDPSCRCAFTGGAGRFSSSRFTIPDTSLNPWDPRPVPMGSLNHERFFSKQLQRTSGFVVYTPAEYRSQQSRRYPVLLLIPGTPGDEYDWTRGGGFVETMFDNLIAEGKMKPTIVVMHASDVLKSGRRVEHLGAFEPLVVNELIPEIKSRYRVESKPDLWAIAGLSLGGEFAMTVGLRHPELFHTAAAFSGSMVEGDFEDRYGKVLTKADQIKTDFRLIWFGCGTGDVFSGGNKALSARFKSAGIPHTFREYEGAHSMPVFRRELADLLPLLFR